MIIHGLRDVVHDINSCPRGFHVEVWSYLDERGEICLYTSELLSPNSWTTGHDQSERRIYYTRYDGYSDPEWSTTRKIREAVRDAWGGMPGTMGSVRKTANRKASARKGARI